MVSRVTRWRSSPAELNRGQAAPAVVSQDALLSAPLVPRHRPPAAGRPPPGCSSFAAGSGVLRPFSRQGTARPSFRVAAEGEVFGLRGTLNAELSAAGPLYHEDGLDVTFTSPDNDLEDMPFAEGRRGGPLPGGGGRRSHVRLGTRPDRANRYRLGIMRGRRGTLRGSHAVGAVVWIVQLGQRDLTEWEAPKGLDDVVRSSSSPTCCNAN